MYTRAEKLHIDTDVKRVCLYYRDKTRKRYKCPRNSEESVCR